MASSQCLVEVRNLKKYYPVRQGLFTSKHQSKTLKAVNGVSFSLQRGESLGIAGESGCGKTTIGRMLLKLIDSTDGQYFFNGRDVTRISSAKEMKAFRRQVQLVFQNPFEALNPRFTVLRSIMDPLLIHKMGSSPSERIEMVKAALHMVNLRPAEAFLNKYPHQLSGGQLQRVVLARALVVEPIFMVADEPVSMLDVSVRAGILNLMKEISAKMQLTTVYISHDLTLLQYLCDYTAIMYLGQIVEYGRTEEVLADPVHPYTKALVAAIPAIDPDEEAKEVGLNSHIPSPIDLPKGCLLNTRCPFVESQCKEQEPELLDRGDGRMVRCHLASAIRQSDEGGRVG